MASYRVCGNPWDYFDAPGEDEGKREGWISQHAVCGPRETPSVGDRVSVGGTDYIVRHWEQVAGEDAPEPCRAGRSPGQGIFDLRLEPA